MTGFHDVLFPQDIAALSRTRLLRATEIVTLTSGRELRNTRFAHGRRAYDAGSGLRCPSALARVTAFFEERRGRLYGFRWRDATDDRSCAPGMVPTPTDQLLGTGDGARTGFDLGKTYGARFAPYRRPITRPVAGSVRVSVGGRELPATAWTLDAASGRVVFATPPPANAEVRAGFLFDVPVRFDTDELVVALADLDQGRASLPVIEIAE